MNEPQLLEIERSLGFTYPPSFHSAVAEFATLCTTPGFKHVFPAASLILSAPEIISEREKMAYRESLGVAWALLPITTPGKHDLYFNKYVPFLREENQDAPDTYAFDLKSQGPEYSVVVWSYSDPMEVHDWDGFPAFFNWLREFVSANEKGKI